LVGQRIQTSIGSFWNWYVRQRYRWWVFTMSWRSDISRHKHILWPFTGFYVRVPTYVQHSIITRADIWNWAIQHSTPQKWCCGTTKDLKNLAPRHGMCFPFGPRKPCGGLKVQQCSRIVKGLTTRSTWQLNLNWVPLVGRLPLCRSLSGSI
jgi:hypothetical protein